MINQELHKINHWLKSNKLSINIHKSKYMLISKGSGYFSINGILPLEAILLSPFIWQQHGGVWIVQVLKCNCFELAFLLAGYFDKGSVHWRKSPECKGMG